MLSDEAIDIIADFIITNEELKNINKYLFDNTELFEEKYTSEYRSELFKYFAGKITRFSRDYNQLMELLTPQEIKKINYRTIVRR